ncbi:MAG: PfkB family carbohydrate kinase, partial [Synechococcaceae cyanobacterium]|nr:PfkB family carbohydrate kinase [Synechococcaceae cyanobacterium]
YLWGSVERVSPEAPVPVLRPRREAERAGAAGNLALNLAALGLDVTLAGCVGSGEQADRLRALWREAGVADDLVVTTDDRPTTVKTRIIAGHQQVLRVDAEDPSPLPDAVVERLATGVAGRIEAGVDVVVLSDYAKGVLSERVCRAAIETAREAGIPVLVDPKGRDWERYRGATLLTPNQKELEARTGVTVTGRDPAALIEAGRGTARELGVAGIVLTRGEHGMVWISADDAVASPARAREVFDVSGAGDTVIASLAASVAVGLGREEALHLANEAAGIVVAAVGTAVVDRRAVLRALHPHGGAIEDALTSLDELLERVAEWRDRGERIVFTNGCFDLLHAGHAVFLQRAAAEGQRLIVGLNSDASVRGLKG